MLLSAFPWLQIRDKWIHCYELIYQRNFHNKKVSFYEHSFPFNIPSTNDSSNTSKILDYDLPLLDTLAYYMTPYTPKPQDPSQQTS